MSSGQSGPGGRTVRSSNSKCTRESVSLVGLMICAADGPPLGRGRSADYLTICTRDIVVSGGFSRMNCGRSAPEARTVRRLI